MIPKPGKTAWIAMSPRELQRLIVSRPSVGSSFSQRLFAQPNRAASTTSTAATWNSVIGRRSSGGAVSRRGGRGGCARGQERRVASASGSPAARILAWVIATS